MPVIQDDLWKHPGHPGMIVVSGHAAVEEDRRLFLGYGPGREAVQRIPGIELQCGQAVLDHAVDGVYGFLPVRPSRPDERLIGFGLFQTRYRWDEEADPELIRYSMECLRAYLDEQPELKVRMNFPAAGEGSLDAETVAPLLLPVPPNVTICHQGEVRPSGPSSFLGFKELYLEVERMLMEGRFNNSVEFLVQHGYDIQSAMEQVRAVERCMRERNDVEARRVREWRRSHTLRASG